MSEQTHPALSRRLSLPLLIFYGLGTTIGAGIFVLVGKVAGRAGMKCSDESAAVQVPRHSCGLWISGVVA